MRKKIFILLTLMLAVCSGAWGQTTIFSYNGNGTTTATSPTVGTSSSTGSGASYAAQKGNYCMKFSSSIVGGNYFTITPTQAFQTGDKITIGNFITSTDGTKNASSQIEFYDSEDTKLTTINSTTITGGSGNTNVLTSNGTPTDEVLTVPAEANGATYFRIGRSGNTTFYVSKLIVTHQNPAPTATSITPGSKTIKVGSTAQLTGSFTGGIFSGTWESDNTSIATVSNTGLVTAVAIGVANIKYKWDDEANDGSEAAYNATATITVLPGFTASDYDLYNVYDFTSMGNVAFTLNESSAGNIWNQANTRKMAVYYCTNEGLENLAVQQAYGEDSGDSKTYMRGWKIVSGSGLFEGNGAGRCAAIGGIKSGQIVEFYHTSGNNFYTKSDGSSDDGIEKTLLWAESGHHVFRADEDGMVGFELDKNNYVTSINIYTTATTTPPSMTESGSVTWDFSSAEKQEAAGTISVGSNKLKATDGTSEIIYYTNSDKCKWDHNGDGYYLYGGGLTSNSNGRFFILPISSNGTLSLTTITNHGTYTIKKCATASTSWNDGTDLTTITTSANGVPVSGDIVYDAEKPYLLIGFPTTKNFTQKIVWKAGEVYLTTSNNMAGWRAFYDADNGYTLDSNTKAYIATEQDENVVKLKSIERGIPAATPVILYTTSSADSYKMTLAKATVEAYNEGTDGTNLLQYTTSAVSDKYRLGYGDSGVGFYPYTGVPTSGAVILNVSSASARALSIVFDEEETGIKKIENAASDRENGAYFNLAGQRVAQPTKGLYIVNGKKVVIK